MKKLLLCLLSFSLTVNAAITERYVTSAGAGAADGTSEADAMSWATFDDYMTLGGSFTNAPGDRFNLKGAFSRTTTSSTWSSSGTTVAPIIVRGYSTVITDGFQGRTNGTDGLVPGNMPTISFTTGLLTVSGSYLILESLNFSSTRNGTALNVATGTDSSLVRCIVTENNTGATAVALTIGQARGTVFNCDLNMIAASGGTAAINCSAGSPRIFGCRINGATSASIQMAVSATVFGSQLYNSVYGVNITSTTAAVVVQNCDIVGCSSNGVQAIAAMTIPMVLLNNMITDNGGFGLEMISTTNGVVSFNNRFRDNVAGKVNNGGDWITGATWGEVTTDTGGPETDYVNSSITDYRLVSTSPAIGAATFMSAIGALQITNATYISSRLSSMSIQ